MTRYAILFNQDKSWEEKKIAFKKITDGSDASNGRGKAKKVKKTKE